MRHCPFPGCGEAIDPRLFACRRHWNKLNVEQKRRIWVAYNSYQRGSISLIALAEEQQAVIAEVQRKEAKRGTEQVRPAGG